MDLEKIRREYLAGGLRRENLVDDPIEQFNVWLSQAVESGITDPTAMVLASVDEHGCPNQRIVLLKQVNSKGLVFYTNYGSAKAKEMTQNNKVCLHFPWHAMERQVRVRGIAEKVSVAESLKYFMSRPRESQLAAWASNQSHKIDSRTFLLTQFGNMKKKFAEGQVPLPDFWGGFRVTPHYFEFWQGGKNRLHDRFEYCLQPNNQWKINRLAP